MSGSVHRDGLDSCDRAAVANWKERSSRKEWRVSVIGDT